MTKEIGEFMEGEVTEHKVDRCSYAEDGMCALHGVEVERRKNMEVLVENIPKILTWQNRIVGWSLLVTIFVAGAFAYISEVKQDMKVQYAEGIGSTATEIKILGKQFEQLATGQARTEERYEALLRSVTEMNNSINTLTYLQFKTKDEKKK